MNDRRRKRLNEIMDHIEVHKVEVEDLLEDELYEERTIPEELHDSSIYARVHKTVCDLQEALKALNALLDALAEATA